MLQTGKVIISLKVLDLQRLMRKSGGIKDYKEFGW